MEVFCPHGTDRRSPSHYTSKDENGDYKVFNAKLVNGKTEKLHIGPDESPKARTSRITGRAIKDALAEMSPGLKYALPPNTI